jgi:hypothetical protein
MKIDTYERGRYSVQATIPDSLSRVPVGFLTIVPSGTDDRVSLETMYDAQNRFYRCPTTALDDLTGNGRADKGPAAARLINNVLTVPREAGHFNIVYFIKKPENGKGQPVIQASIAFTGGYPDSGILSPMMLVYGNGRAQIGALRRDGAPPEIVTGDAQLAPLAQDVELEFSTPLDQVEIPFLIPGNGELRISTLNPIQSIRPLDLEHRV